MATAPNQVWSWDITKLLGPAKWTYFHLYVILDIFSRYVVGWMLASRESEHLAERLIRETVVKEGVARDQLTIHSDRGPSMRSQTVAQLLATLGITKSHSRPHVSDDNPFSESQFKTLKYRPEFPDRFASIEHGLEFCGKFFHWQNHEHHHWGLGLLTPAMVHLRPGRRGAGRPAGGAHRGLCCPSRTIRSATAATAGAAAAKSGSTLRPMGRNPVCYNYRATLISYRSCLKPVDTFRPFFIRALGRKGAVMNPGPLFNMTWGGDSRHEPTARTRQKLAATHRQEMGRPIISTTDA